MGDFLEPMITNVFFVFGGGICIYIYIICILVYIYRNFMGIPWNSNGFWEDERYKLGSLSSPSEGSRYVSLPI